MTFKPPEQDYDHTEDDALLHDLSHTIPQASTSFQQQLEDSLIAHLHYQQKEDAMKRKRKPTTLFPVTMIAAVVTLFIAGGIFFVMEHDTASPDLAAPIGIAPVACESGWTGTYRVIQGDNFFELSERFRVPVEEMLRENCINTPPQLIDADIVLNVPQQKVLVASEDIDPHHVLTADNVRLVSINTDIIPDNAILEPDNAVGEVSMTSIRRGQIIVEEMVFNDTGFQVVTATRDITPGVTLDASMLQITEFPAYLLIGQYFPEVDLLIGETVERELTADSIIIPEYIVDGHAILEEYIFRSERLETSNVYLSGSRIIVEGVQDRGNVTDERIILRNDSDDAFDISGWSISDRNGNRYTIEPDTSIFGNGEFTIYTRKGRNTRSVAHMGFEESIWWEQNDYLTIIDDDGRLTISIALDDLVQETLDVVISRRVIPRGAFITEDMLETGTFSHGVLFETDLFMQDIEDVVGRIAQARIGQGQVILSQDLNNLYPYETQLIGTHLFMQHIEDRGDIQNERIILRNDGDTAVDISNWSIRDREDNTYTVQPGAIIAPGDILMIYTRAGQSDQNTQYMGFEQAIWGDARDEITILDDEGRIRIIVSLARENIVIQLDNTMVSISGIIGAGRHEAERIQIYNPGDTLDMTGWTLSDENNNIYTFGETRLFTGAELTVYTRYGQDTPINFYQNQDNAILGHGEVITLRDNEGHIQSEFVVDMFDQQPENLVALALPYNGEDAARNPIERGDFVDVISVMDYVDIDDATHPEQLTGQSPENVRATLQHPIKGALVLYSGEAAGYPPLGNVPLLNDVNIQENVVVLLLPQKDAEIMRWMLENDFPYTFALRR